MDPEIKKISSGPVFKPSGKASSGTVWFDLEKHQVSTDEGMKAELNVEAEIWDYGGNIICTLDSMVNEAMSTWENFITTYNLK